MNNIYILRFIHRPFPGLMNRSAIISHLIKYKSANGIAIGINPRSLTPVSLIKNLNIPVRHILYQCMVLICFLPNNHRTSLLRDIINHYILKCNILDRSGSGATRRILGNRKPRTVTIQLATAGFKQIGRIFHNHTILYRAITYSCTSICPALGTNNNSPCIIRPNQIILYTNIPGCRHRKGIHLQSNAVVVCTYETILLPEIPYDIDKIIEAIHKRAASGHGFTILAVAEGAISKEDAALPKKELKEKIKKRKHPSVSYELAEQIFQKTGIEVRITVPGHTQRGGNPCPYDRVLSTRLGAEAATLIMKKEYGYMVGIINGKVKKVPLGDVAGKLKMVSPDDQLIKEAKCIGISFGV